MSSFTYSGGYGNESMYSSICCNTSQATRIFSLILVATLLAASPWVDCLILTVCSWLLWLVHCTCCWSGVLLPHCLHRRWILAIKPLRCPTALEDWLPLYLPNLDKPLETYVDVFEVVIRIVTHAVPPQTVRHLHLFLLQCLVFLIALLVVPLEPLPAKLINICLVGDYITPQAIVPGQFRPPVKLQSLGRSRSICIPPFNSLCTSVIEFDSTPEQGQTWVVNPGRTQVRLCSCKPFNQIEPEINSGLTRVNRSTWNG